MCPSAPSSVAPKFSEYYYDIEDDDDDSNYLDLSTIKTKTPITLEPGSIPITKTQINASHESHPVQVLEADVIGDYVTDLMLTALTAFMVLPRLPNLFLLKIEEGQGPIDADRVFIDKTNSYVRQELGLHYLFSENEEITEVEMNREEFDIEDENDVVFFGPRVFFTVKRTPKAMVADSEVSESMDVAVPEVSEPVPEPMIVTPTVCESVPALIDTPHHTRPSVNLFGVIADLLAPTDEQIGLPLNTEGMMGTACRALYPVLEEMDCQASSPFNAGEMERLASSALYPDIDELSPDPIPAVPMITIELDTLQRLVDKAEAQGSHINMIGATVMQLQCLVTDSEAKEIAENLSMEPIDQLAALNTDILNILKQCRQ